jgi:hypothetical protein
MEPANSIIIMLGGNAAVAAIAGVHPTRVANWKRSKAVGGTGGSIPFKHAEVLIAAAKTKGLSLAADDFLPSKTRAVA